MSAQMKIFKIALGLPKGHAIIVPGSLVRDASQDNLSMIDRMGPARREDVEDFVKMAKSNWGVSITETDFGNSFEIFKPNEGGK
ncbi:MAG: hypothetical protein JKY53_00295 [Flavobacteriales bacterium]|nr:hypothetical protein [Flavobacteriales bacterium]